MRRRILAAAVLLEVLTAFFAPTDWQVTSKTLQQPTPTKFDDFGNVRWNDLKARLDNFAIDLQQTQNRGVIIVYASRNCSRPGEATNLARNAKSYLNDARGVPAGKVSAINGGFREERSWELWVLPPMSSQPKPTPTFRRSRARVSNRCPALPPNNM